MKITRKHKAESYKTPEEEGLISKLPTNILKKIFSKLDFSSISRCPFSRTDHIENFERNGSGTLSDFSLRKNRSVRDEDIQAYLNVTNNITKLDLYGCKNLTDISCEKLVTACPSLVKLDIGSCQFTDKALKAISKHCGNLGYINISWNEKITDEGVAALAQGCRILETFMCKATAISDTALQNLAIQCPYLKVINIGFMGISDETVTVISKNCILLQHLCVENCKNLTDESLNALSKHCRNLKILEAARCAKFTDAGFEALAANCPFLEKMDLDDCELITDRTLECLAIGCPKLQAMSLSGCELITDEGIRHLSVGACASSSLTLLALDNLPQLTDQIGDYLLAIKNLEKVELFDCEGITNITLDKLYNHPSQKLKVQVLVQEKPITNDFNSWCFLYSDVVVVVIFVLILITCLVLVTLTYGYFTFFNYFSR